MLDHVGIRPVCWFRSPVQVQYNILVLFVKFGKKQDWFDVIRTSGCKDRNLNVLKDFMFFGVESVVLGVISAIWSLEQVCTMLLDLCEYSEWSPEGSGKFQA